MTVTATANREALAKAIDEVEAAYEFLLSYAAQGRRTEAEGDGSGVREFLRRGETALALIEARTAEMLGPPATEPGVRDFVGLVSQDAGRARALFQFVLAQKSIGSQMAANLNATSQVKTIVTDLYLLDESLKISGL